jgi:DNA-binding CsgD family transcriptional regulator
MTTTTAPTPRRGRPRPANTIARDEEIYALLADGPRSRNSIATQLGLEKSLVYLALDRLRHTGRIRQCIQDSAIVWAIADGTPCP